MSYIIDRLILIAISILILLQGGSITEVIVVGLLAVVVAGLCYYMDSKGINFIIGIAYFIGVIIFPPIIYVSPVVMYELYWKKLYWEMGVLAVAEIIGFIRLDNMPLATIMLLYVVEILSCVLCYKTEKNYILHTDNIHIRDDSEERTLLLAEKNRHLIEKQDSDIYVATLKERNRIARDIHDNVGHMLTRSILQMGALMTIHKEDPLHGQLESVKTNLDVAMNNIRESVHDLHDESIDLKQVISDIMEELKDSFNCSIDYDMSKDVDRKYKYAIIGIVKEAVSNIIKHSKSDNVDIVIREHPGMYQLIVHDYLNKKVSGNDSGKENFETGTKKLLEINEGNAGKSSGIGLQNMQDRVSALKGNISIDTKNGYKIFITFPKV